PVDERKPRVHLDGKAAVGRGNEDLASDAQRLEDEPALTFSSTDVLDDGVREHDVELAVGEGQRAGVALDVANPWIARPDPGPVLQPERGHALRPRVVLLEEVECVAPVPLPEGELVRPDVEDRGLGGGAQLVEE